MFNPYTILGLPQTASREEAKLAYRRLAMTYHPDRVDEGQKRMAESRFKEIQGAWELIDNGWIDTPLPRQTSAPSTRWSKPEAVWQGVAPDMSSFNEFRTHKPWTVHRAANLHGGSKPMFVPQQNGKRLVEAEATPQRKNLGDFIARVPMSEAYRGFIVEVVINGKKVQVTMPEGVPHMLRNTFPLDGDDITVTTHFTQNVFTFNGIDTALREATLANSEPAVVHRTGILSLSVEVPVKELARGTTLKLEDFLGEKFDVKLPPGYDARIPFRIEGRGYVDWFTSHSQASAKRSLLYLKIIPTDTVEMSHLQ